MKTNNFNPNSDNKSFDQEKRPCPVSIAQKLKTSTKFFEQNILSTNIASQDDHDSLSIHRQKIEQVLKQIAKIEELPKPFITKQDIYQAKQLEILIAEDESEYNMGIILHAGKEIVYSICGYCILVQQINQQIKYRVNSRPDGPNPDFLILCDIPEKISDDLQDLYSFLCQTYCYIKDEINDYLQELSKHWRLHFYHLPKFNHKVDLANNFLTDSSYDLEKLYATEPSSSIMEIARLEYIRQTQSVRLKPIIRHIQSETEDQTNLEIAKKFHQAKKIMKCRKQEFIKMLLKAISIDNSQKITDLLDQIIKNKQSISED